MFFNTMNCFFFKQRSSGRTTDFNTYYVTDNDLLLFYNFWSNDVVGKLVYLKEQYFKKTLMDFVDIS